jgi:drug/metabolite transporter (DMT)-like permease
LLRDARDVVVALVLLSAFLHAAWNALLKGEPDKDRAVIAVVAVATLIAAAVAGTRWAVTGQLPFAAPEEAGWSLAAGAFELLYFMALAKALALGQLGTVYTVSRGGSVLAVYPLSIAIYGEHVTATSATGSAIVFLGLVLAGVQPGHRGESKPGALAWAIACAASIAGYHLAYKAALADREASPSAVFAVGLAFATAINVVRTGAAGRAATAALFRTKLARVALMGAICGGSFLILMEALSGAGAGFVLTLRNTSVLFATLLAWAIGERPARTTALGSLLVAAGAIVMSL